MTNFAAINNPKLFAFEFVLKSLLKWNKEERGSEENNDLSIIKAIKLLFFVTAVKTKNGGENLLLKTVFDNFVAMPYGHVESGIYEEIRRREGVLNYYKINNSCTTLISPNGVFDLEEKVPQNVRIEIISSVNELKYVNSDLIRLSAFELVDLSHSWYSWKKTFSQAKKAGLGSKPIPPDVIIQEDKIFSLQIF